jgi:DNA-binding transcriptional LysR family regulator
MDLRQLRTLAEVVDRGSFSAAAESLGISQPAVSQQIRALETDVGAKLLERGRRTRLTDRGRLVDRYARRMLALSEEFRRELDDDGELTGPLEIGSSTGLGEHLMPLLLGEFRAQHPGVRVSLRIEATATVIGHVLERELELGVVGAVRPHRGLVYEPFLRDRVILAVPPGHRFASRMVTLTELVSEPLIVMQPGAGIRIVIDEELRKAGMRARDLKIAMELGLQESAKAAVEAGYGVSFLSRLAVERELRLGSLSIATVVGIEPTREFSTVRASGIELSRTTAAFLTWARLKADEQSAELMTGGRRRSGSAPKPNRR